MEKTLQTPIEKHFFLPSLETESLNLFPQYTEKKMKGRPNGEKGMAFKYIEGLLFKL